MNDIDELVKRIQREARNQMCIDGHLNQALDDIMRSNSPDGTFNLLGVLADQAIELTSSGFAAALETLRSDLSDAIQAKRNMSGMLDAALEQNERMKAELEEARKDADKWQRESIYLEGLLDGVETDMRRFIVVRAARQQQG